LATKVTNVLLASALTLKIIRLLLTHILAPFLYVQFRFVSCYEDDGEQFTKTNAKIQ